MDDSVSDLSADVPGLKPAQHLLHEVIAAASAQIEDFPADGACWQARGATVLAANLTAGRFGLSPASPSNAVALVAYARQVLNGMLAEWERVESLRAGEHAAWTAVHSRLERLAYHWLGPAGREAWAAWEAREVASKTCADVWQWLQTHTFPFDVPFDRWVTRALTNRLQEAARRRNARARYEVDSLDRPLLDRDMTFGEEIAANSLEEWLAVSANREMLLQALAQIEQKPAAVVRLWYLEGWPAGEIAAALGMTVNNVYVMRFRAVERLRKLLRYDERYGLAEIFRSREARKRSPEPVTASSKLEAPHV